jgi:hypothetical protein
MSKLFLFISILLILTSCKQQRKLSPDPISKSRQDSIIEKYLKQGAWQHHYIQKNGISTLMKG